MEIVINIVTETLLNISRKLFQIDPVFYSFYHPFRLPDCSLLLSTTECKYIDEFPRCLFINFPILLGRRKVDFVILSIIHGCLLSTPPPQAV